MAARKALFSKPAWAAKPKGPVEVDQPIFQQNVYEDILQERQRKEERKLLKQKEKHEKAQRERKSESRETKVDEERTVKKRRISNNDASVDLEGDSEDAIDEETSDSDSSSKSDSEKNVKSKLTRGSKISARDAKGSSSSRSEPSKTDNTHTSSSLPSSNTANGPILVEDDDDDEIVITDIVPTPKRPPQAKPIAKAKPPPPPELESESEEEDEYIRELKRKARKEAREKNSQAATTNAKSNTGPSLTTVRASSVEESNNTTAPTVQILIHTILPNCPAVIIKRRPSQTLESVHTYYCQQNNLNEIIRDKLFFTWNNQRLFKSTTTRSILDQIKRKYGRDDSKGKIELEAVTDEIYEHRIRQKEESRRRAENDEEEGEGSNTQLNGQTNVSGTPLIDAATGAIMGATGTNQDQMTSTSGTGGVGVPPKSPGIVIKLTPGDGSGFKPLSLRVHAHTTIERIVRGYKSRTEVEPAKEIYLVFEGDRLEGVMTVDQAGFEDGDSVDVRSK